MSVEARRARGGRVLTRLHELYPTVRSMLTYHEDRPYEFLFAVIMSAQTTDRQVNVLTDTLYRTYVRLQDYIAAPLSELERDMSVIGLYRAKARSIQATARILMERYEGVVPRTMDELIELPGVGRKTASVVLGHLYGIASGIAVDTHVQRLSQKYSLTSQSTPGAIERDLMEILPQSEWIGYTNRMVWYGRDYCPARCRACPTCPLWEAV